MLKTLESLFYNNAILAIVYITLIIVASIFFHIIVKHLIFKIIRHILAKQTPNSLDQLEKVHFFRLLAYLAPIIVTYIAFKYFPFQQINKSSVQFILGCLNVGIVTISLLIINALISVALNHISPRFLSGGKTLIRTLSQVFKIILTMTGIIVIFSIILNKSPIVILSSLGALTAILLLVFKDSILGFAASIQVTLLGNVKVGDWIEMPKFNADGTVMDISISSIRVQNWDKTITTIPTYSLVSEPVKNWRGMEESNMRRIRRHILVDISSIGFLTSDQLINLKKVNQLKTYLATALPEIELYNKAQENNSEAINLRNLTNIGLFRNYLYSYLKSHPNINSSATILVRQKQHLPTGVPLEIYCFTNTPEWIPFENIQSDIFDHIFSIANTFGLKVYQYQTQTTINKN